MGALAGVRVLDLSTGVAGAITGMFLGDHGADVIKVEPPEGDWARGLAGFVVWNRNKRGVVVDGTSSAETEWLATNVARADVVILGSHDLEEFGTSVVEAAHANPRLVIVRLPAYLDGHTPWTGAPESNGLLCALTGQARRQWSHEGGPIDTVSSFVLHVQGLLGAVAAAAALLERFDSGRGQAVTVTGVQAMIQFNILSLSTHPAEPDAETKVGPTGRVPAYRPFLSNDGRWVACGALGPKFETALLTQLDLNWVLEDPRIAGDTTRMATPENLFWCNQAITDAFAARTADELLELMSAVGIPCGLVSDRDEWLDNPQLEAIGMRAEVTDGAGREIVMPGVAAHLTETPGAIRSAAPLLGEHGLPEPWSALPETDAEQAPRFVPGPLHGCTVLNLGTFVATPYAGFMLADLGATVIKVEPLTGDPFRGAAYTFNRGMHSLAIDLRSEAGQEVFHRLAEQSDVVVDGMRPGVMTELNLDYATLAAINPQIVTLSLSAYGEGGPDSARPGVDMVIQAQSGMMAAQGGDSQPVANTISVNDGTTAAMSVFAVVLALYHRRSTGRGQRIWDSLVATSAFLQDSELVRYEGRPAPQTGGRDFAGPAALQRYYQVADGWIYIDADPSAGGAGDVAARLREAGVLDDGTLDESSLGGGLARLTVEESTSLLNGIGVRAAAARTISQVLSDPLLLDHEAFHIHMEDDGQASFMLSGRHFGFSRTQRRGPLSPPGVGEHTVDLLKGCGLGQAEIDDLIADDVVRTGGPIPRRLPTPYR